MDFKRTLYGILSDINKYEKRNVMEGCVQAKLERSLENYHSQLEDTCRYFLTRNPIVVLKGIAKTFEDDEEEESNDL